MTGNSDSSRLGIRYFLLIAASLFITYSLALIFTHRQSAVWMAPYLSASANLHFPPSFQINTDEIARFCELKTPWSQDLFTFFPSSPLTPYLYNDIGYVYLIWFAGKLFPFLGQQGSIIGLQAIIHLSICMTLLSSRPRSKKWRRAFLVLYAINPIILMYVTFNHYYFWTVVASFGIVLLIPKKRSERERVILYGTLFILPWAVMARSTAITLLPLLLFLILRRLGLTRALLFSAYLFIVFLTFWKPSEKNPWHTAYIGVGAYQNPWNIQLTDHSGAVLVNLFIRQIPNQKEIKSIESANIQAIYRPLAKKTTLEQFTAHPFLYAKNAFINGLLSFGTGYLTGKPDGINYVLSFTGLGTLLLFVTRRLGFYLIAVFLGGIGFVLYYPPVPAYMYGSYLLIVMGVLEALLGRSMTGPPHRILYLSFNDGSDTRVNKEIGTLVASGASVDFLGIGPSTASCFVSESNTSKIYFIRGNRKSVISAAVYFLQATALMIRNRYHSIHVINEPQLIILWPILLFQRHVVVDLFDSLFLRKNLPGNRYTFLKQLIYFPADQIIVTDSNRFRHSADAVKGKTLILPNYPKRYIGPRQRKQTGNTLTIMYYGWLSQHRGTSLLNGLLNSPYPVDVLMAGWIADDQTSALTRHPRARWLGTIPQHEALRITATQADYILCLYAPINDNNKNASPNKIFDAIQIDKPVIINAETVVSNFVSTYRTGVVVPDFDSVELDTLYHTLITFLETYQPDPQLKTKFIWENIEQLLVSAHRL